MLQAKQPTCRYHGGSTVVEYGLIGSLVVLMLMAGFLGLGGKLRHWLDGLKGEMGTQISAADHAEAARLKAIIDHETQAPIEVAAPASLIPGCPPGQTCSTDPVQPYRPTETVGANGINVVDEYADLLYELAKTLKLSSKVHPDFIDMIIDLANEGHRVADDERSVLTHTRASDGGFDFSIQERYAQTKARALNYLKAHPNELTPEQAKVLNQASNNITLQMVDFIGNANPSSLSGLNINPKFTDKGGGNGAGYVDDQADKICKTGGKCP